MPVRTILALVATLMSIPLIAMAKGDQGESWGFPMEGCRISLTTDHDQYRFGEPINLHVILQNTVHREVVFSEGGLFPYDIDIALPNGGTSPPTLWRQRIVSSLKAYVGSNTLVHLGPGEFKSENLNMINREFDMSLEGKYTVIVRRRLPSESDPNAWIEVFSNPIVIEIKNPNY